MSYPISRLNVKPSLLAAFLHTFWAVINHKGEVTIVSNSELGAKQYATRRDYTQICRVSPHSLQCICISTKIGNKWIAEGKNNLVSSLDNVEDKIIQAKAKLTQED